jgi:ATP-dependent protease ClpP protease subunit
MVYKKDDKTKKPDITQTLSDVHAHCVNLHSREIYLHPRYSDDEGGIEYKMATTFIKNLHLLNHGSRKNILVHMQTDGGSWADGMAMFNAIKFSKSPVTILAYAQASSMSGILLQAADKRVLMPDCYYMIHHGSVYIDDNSMAASSAVEVNNSQCKRMLQIFSERAINGEHFKDSSEPQVTKFIDKKIKENSDWYLAPDDAVYYGFADGVLGDDGVETLEKIRIGRKIK